MLHQVHQSLLKLVDRSAAKATVAFKTKPGQYGHQDKFLGVSNPKLHVLAKELKDLPLSVLQKLLKSKFNEERLLALFILVAQYKKASSEGKQQIYEFYLNNLQHVNNWNLVDASAHHIIGVHLLDKSRNILNELAKSKVLWERRTAIVATLTFIHHHEYADTLKIATILLHDHEDLIHKATGWLLREVGKKSLPVLLEFLEKHACQMPRTMLRYAIEKLSPTARIKFLNKK